MSPTVPASRRRRSRVCSPGPRPSPRTPGAGALTRLTTPGARSLPQRRTGNLGIVVPDITNSFSATITKAVQREARRHGYALFVAASDADAPDEAQCARGMPAQVDGLLMVPPQLPAESLLA